MIQYKYGYERYKYLVTIRKHQVKDYVDQTMIDIVILHLKLKHDTLRVLDHCYEIDKTYHQLHFHGIVELCHKISYKNNSKFNCFRIHWSPIGDLCGAIRYVHKDAYNEPSQEQILTLNKYCHPMATNGFIPTSA